MLFVCAVLCGTVRAASFYWEPPYAAVPGNAEFPRTVRTSDGSSWLFWQETGDGGIWISGRRYFSPDEYADFPHIAGPFMYSGGIPDIFSAAASPDGTVAVAVLSAADEVTVVSSERSCGFVPRVLKISGSPVAPRIYAQSDGRFRLFVSVNNGGIFSIRYALSPDGQKWTGFADFAPAGRMRNPFVPFLVPSENGDAVAFQAQTVTAEGRLSYQIFCTFSGPSGNWSEPLLLTSGRFSAGGAETDLSLTQNQRPYLVNSGGRMLMVWENSGGSVSGSSLWCAEVTGSGLRADTVERISSGGDASGAAVFVCGGREYAVWSEGGGEESVNAMELASGNSLEIPSVPGRNRFASPVVTDIDGREILSFVWQNSSGGKNSIIMTSPDVSAQPPQVRAVSYKEGIPSGEGKAEFEISFSDDASGTAGYSWSWTQDPGVSAPERLMAFSDRRRLVLKAGSDGKWFLSVRTADYAGNWSEPAAAVYELDTVPPSPPEICEPDADIRGFLSSNSFSMSWNPSPDGDTAGYFYSLEHIGKIPSGIMGGPDDEAWTADAISARYSGKASRMRVSGKDSFTAACATAEFRNRRNGVYAFAVAAVDMAGNIGMPSVRIVVLNKFVPFTAIYAAREIRRPGTEAELEISGEGFLSGGHVESIFFTGDLSGYRAMTLADGFSVESDTRITGVRTGALLDSGTYRVGIVHSGRGTYISAPLLEAGQNGTVKITAPYRFGRKYVFAERRVGTAVKFPAAVSMICAAAVLAVLALSAAVSFARRRADFSAARNSLAAGIISERRSGMGGRRSKLRNKLIFQTMILVGMTAVIVSWMIGTVFTVTQEKTLAAGLQSKINVLMDSICLSVRNFLPSGNILELSLLTQQADAMDEVMDITITARKMGYVPGDEDADLGYIWASGRPELQNLISEYGYGRRKLDDGATAEILGSMSVLESHLEMTEKEASARIGSLTERARALARSSGEGAVREFNAVSAEAQKLSRELDVRLGEAAFRAGGSWPYFDTGKINRDNTAYLFYRPVVFRQGTDGSYVHAVVFVEISTGLLVEAVRKGQLRIIMTGTLVALAAVLVGAAGAFSAASRIVNPIRNIEEQLHVIERTKDKEKLKDSMISAVTDDEIGHLADVVNELTRELARAAENERLLMDGKVVQQAFLPLDTTQSGIKQTTARFDDGQIECFGYYEGASGVSGDYFDWRKLDSRWYGIIKCDASGHGVPAAIIMTVVAVLFRRYFRSWSYERNGVAINSLVVQINDFIATLGVRGKFAAMIVCLLDSRTGELYMCNAGDNIVHIYDRSAGKLRTVGLSPVPVVGPFLSAEIESSGGYRVEKTVLGHGDCIFLYTDGIEESVRKIRDADGRTIKTDDGYFREKSEQLGQANLRAVIEAVMDRRAFILRKDRADGGAECLEFDFSNCGGTVGDAVIALAAVEKVFRMHSGHSSGSGDKIRVDRKIDLFLRKCFKGYGACCRPAGDVPDSPNYIYYSGTAEDEQLDDLTLLAVRLS